MVVVGRLLRHIRGIAREEIDVQGAVRPTALGHNLREPIRLDAVFDTVFAALLPANIETRVTDLRQALKTLDAKIARLTNAVEDGAAVVSLIDRLSARQREREALLQQVAVAESQASLALDRECIAAKVQVALAKWQTLLTESVADGRQVLREVLEAPLTFTPEGKSYRFEGPIAVGQLLDGVVPPTSGMTRAGIEPAAL